MDVAPYKILEFTANEWPDWYRDFRDTARGLLNVRMAEYNASCSFNITDEKSISILTFYSKEGYTRFFLEWIK